jgi:hypothetical protein
MSFATAFDSPCVDCKLRGKVMLCPLYKVRCKHEKDIPLSSKTETGQIEDKGKDKIFKDVDNELS